MSNGNQQVHRLLTPSKALMVVAIKAGIEKYRKALKAIPEDQRLAMHSGTWIAPDPVCHCGMLFSEHNELTSNHTPVNESKFDALYLYDNEVAKKHSNFFIPTIP